MQLRSEQDRQLDLLALVVQSEEVLIGSSPSLSGILVSIASVELMIRTDYRFRRKLYLPVDSRLWLWVI